MSVINRSELQRIRENLEPAPERGNKAERRAELKKKSNDRLQNWPNTLEALRKKKESFLKDRESREEAARREIDLQEAEYRKNMRLESIKRANQLLYEQTDKMKMLRSQQLYSDVLQVRSEQVLEKDIRKKALIEKEKAYHEDLLVQIQDGEERDAQKAIEEQNKINAISKTREQQLQEARKRREAEKLAERELGEILAHNAQEAIIEDFKLQEEADRKSKMRAAEMIDANEKLLDMRYEQRQKELNDEKEREREIKLTEDRNYARKALEKRRFDKAQKTRQRMIDAAVVNLTEQFQKENTRLLKQEIELKDKTDREWKEKEQKRQDEWNKCVESRTLQVVDKRTKEQKLKDDEQRYSELMKIQAEAEKQREKEKEMKERERVKQIKALQLQEAIEVQRKKVEAKILDVEEAGVIRDLGVQDDMKFLDVVESEIERYAKEGKSVYTLKVAREAHAPDLLPAILVKSNNRNFNKKS
mmetsp:Transcript_2917/g.3074  ORF Transcript_2917/g.3074 Transcript_2917/m.3074 type:complete len:475 (-) Transcript_2917:209-1633(-)|eukprot:CAMPEP_0182429064 /NCGR_PEP_ID=MMETSP1167-20130531/25483_1 /TAXON_ID=2988 /ORGANISM="Mallomonas Sp, Strain CCMP3275" /LENGTH=474 /DNA_ID=CAMNT_0024612373 /DNA_START=181 /DNA_END=1605 /DNA_ORIENTATION=-